MIPAAFGKLRQLEREEILQHNHKPSPAAERKPLCNLFRSERSPSELVKNSQRRNREPAAI